MKGILSIGLIFIVTRDIIRNRIIIRHDWVNELDMQFHKASILWLINFEELGYIKLLLYRRVSHLFIADILPRTLPWRIALFILGHLIAFAISIQKILTSGF